MEAEEHNICWINEGASTLPDEVPVKHTAGNLSKIQGDTGNAAWVASIRTDKAPHNEYTQTHTLHMWVAELGLWSI